MYENRSYGVRPATAGGVATGDEDEAGVGRGAIPVSRTAAFEPDRGHFTLLRETGSACSRALSPRYAAPAYQLALQQKHGLSIGTGRRLRRLFGEGNVSACRSVVEPPL